MHINKTHRYWLSSYRTVKQRIYILKNNSFEICREIIIVYCKNVNKHVYTQREQCLRAFLMRVVRTVTTVLQRKKMSSLSLVSLKDEKVNLSLSTQWRRMGSRSLAPFILIFDLGGSAWLNLRSVRFSRGKGRAGGWGRIVRDDLDVSEKKISWELRYSGLLRSE
jgi:hypothetical protein